MSFLSQSLILFVSLYQSFLSGFFGGNCRFYPSCSHYAIEVSKTQPFFLALKLITVRLLKCHPFGKKGFDPAPLPNERKV